MFGRPATTTAPEREQIPPAPTSLPDAAAQAPAIVLDAAHKNTANRALVDVCLDVRNTLLPALEADAKARR